jgi:hypothetical protein
VNYGMKLESTATVDHRSMTAQPLGAGLTGAGFGVVVPGASSCCAGCTSSSCGTIARP